MPRGQKIEKGKKPMFGYNGRILRVNLSEEKITVEEPGEDYYKRYLGGRGFIAATLLQEMPGGVDPLGPENKLIFALGPITGMPLPGGGRNSVGAKSPLTGGFGESEAGGFFGAELKKAGFDAVIVEGAAKAPLYLWIKDGNAELRDARSLWGLEPKETQQEIRKELQDPLIRTAAIGPGGENLVRFACILNDLSHAYGRSGMGAVMGAKKLKAIAVRGKFVPPMANEKAVRDLARWMAHKTLYGCTYSLLTNWYPRLKVGAKFADFTNLEEVKQHITKRTRVVYMESPINPTLGLIDLEAVAQIVKEANSKRAMEDRIYTVVDSTFATPFCQRPLKLGIDFVVHSLTKAIGGFGTDIGGVVIGPNWSKDPLMLYRKDFGGVLSPKSAWPVLVTGLPSLAVRMRQMQNTAMKVAEFLETCPEVERTRYPGLKSFAQYDLAQRQMRDYDGNFAPGAVIYFIMKGDVCSGPLRAVYQSPGEACLLYHARRESRKHPDPD